MSAALALVGEAFGNDLDSPHLQQFYYIYTEYLTNASATHSRPMLYIAVISLGASTWLHRIIH
jgi:hypothetical protein